MTMHPNRGMFFVRAQNATIPTALLAEITASVETFKANQKQAIDGVNREIDQINKVVAALKVGGAVGDDFGDMNENTTTLCAALRTLIRHGDEAPMAAIVASAGMSSDINEDGGYTVIPQLGNNMNKRVHEISPMRSVARVVTVSSDTYEELNDLDEVGAGWVGERESRPDTASPTFGKLSVPVHEMYAMPKCTQRLLDDAAINIAAWLVEKCAQRFARKEGAAFINGDGVQKPRGLLTYPTAAEDDAERDWGTIEHINTGTSASFGAAGADTLIDTIYAVKAQYRANSVWMMNRKTAAVVRKMKDGDGRFLWSDGLAAGQPALLLGFPVVLDEEMPDIGAGSLSIAFGDMGAAYLIADRHGLKLLRDPFTDKPNVRFYTYKRVGGAVANFEAVKLIRFGTA